MIDAQREALAQLRADRAFPAEILNEVEHDLDVDESRIR